MEGGDSSTVLCSVQTSLEIFCLRQRDVGKPKHCQRRMSRHMKSAYGLVERIKGIYLSQEETSRKNSREEIGGTVVLPCAAQDFALKPRLKPKSSFQESLFFFPQKSKLDLFFDYC